MITTGAAVISPDKFVICFSIAILCLIFGFGSMNGPRVYIKNLFVSKNLYASIILFSAMLLSLYFAMIAKSFTMSLLMAILELNAVFYFFCNTTPVDLSTLKWMAKAFWATI